MVFVPVVSLLLLGAFQGDNRLNAPNPVSVFFKWGNRVGAGFGGSLAGVGDQNHDGFDDVLIAVRGDRQVQLFFGGSPMDTSADLTFFKDEPYFAYRVASIGDIDGDGGTDFAIASLTVGVYIYHGGALDTTAVLMLPSGRVTGAGDVNGDGFDDVLWSDASWNDYQGLVHLYYGGFPMDTVADWTMTGDSAQSWFGYSISGNGDLNGDSCADFAVFGEKLYSTGSYVLVYFGSPSGDPGLALEFESSELPELIGLPAIVGDVNRDDHDDLVLTSGNNLMQLYFGRDSMTTTPDRQLRGGQYTSLSGPPAAGVGDVNGDGAADIVKGNPGSWGELGEVLLYLGHPGMSGEFDLGWTGFMADWAGAGQAVSWCGDVNGDGLDDIMFSSYDDYFNPNGRVDIFSGDSTLVVSVRENKTPRIPSELSLGQNYPNPFNSGTRIQFAIGQPQALTLEIYDLSGRRVRTIFSDRVFPAGEHNVTWDGRDDDGMDVATGMYLYRLQGTTVSSVRKLILLR